MKQNVMLIIVITLTLTSQLVTAGSITDTYASGDTLTANKMETIKSAVNDNNSKISINTGNIDANATDIGTKQDRVTGSCSGNSAISGVLSDGSVNCQSTYPTTGYVSVSSAVARKENDSNNNTSLWTGAVGIARASSNQDNFLIRLIAPVNIPHGASITSFSFKVYDSWDGVNGTAELFRDDGTLIATAISSGNSGIEIATVGVASGTVVDNSQYGYFVKMDSRLNYPTGEIYPINTTVGYTLP